MISIVDEIAINSDVNVTILVEIVATIIVAAAAAAAVVTGAMEGKTALDFTLFFDVIHLSRRIALCH